jgi:hypothetical protein
MLRKQLFIALSALLLTGSAAYADEYGEAAQGDQSHQSQFTDRGNFAPKPQEPGSQGEWVTPWTDSMGKEEHNYTAPSKRTDTTHSGQYDPGAGSMQGPQFQAGAPPSAGQNFDSGAATGSPIPGSFIAPSNIALNTQYRTNKLPPTRMDSFVYNSGKVWNPWLIYGDEGTFGPPPLDNFLWINRIERGIDGNPEYERGGAGLTTLHHDSSLPEAWDYPE